MEDLLTNYSLSDILVIAVLIVLAVKEGFSVYDWFKYKLKKSSEKEYRAKKEKEKLEEKIGGLNNDKRTVDGNFIKVNEKFEKLQAQIEMLIESDKENIKSFITLQHHRFVYEQGWIDDYSLECLEKRFHIYEKEHGNSFVLGLMNEIRSLPKRPPYDIEHKYTDTAEYVKKAKE